MPTGPQPSPAHSRTRATAMAAELSEQPAHIVTSLLSRSRPDSYNRDDAPNLFFLALGSRTHTRRTPRLAKHTALASKRIRSLAQSNRDHKGKFERFNQDHCLQRFDRDRAQNCKRAGGEAAERRAQSELELERHSGRQLAAYERRVLVDDRFHLRLSLLCELSECVELSFDPDWNR